MRQALKFLSMAGNERVPVGGIKQIVVTGGTGFIGRCLLHRIRHQHLDTLQPIALVRPSPISDGAVSLERILDYPSPTNAVKVVDFSDVKSVQTALYDADIVVHLAADMDFFPRDKEAMFMRNVNLTQTMIRAATAEATRKGRSSPLRFVYVSSTEAVGPTSKTGADESAEHNPTSAYGRSKSACETLVQREGDSLEIVIARPTGVIGPGERFFFYEFCSLVAMGLTVVGPTPMIGRLSCTHVDDAVSALLLLSTHKSARGVYHISADGSATYREYLETISERMACPKPILYLPLSIGKILVRVLGPIMNRKKRRTFMWQQRTMDETMQYRVYKNDRLKTLGFTPKYGILRGVEETVDYELSTGGIRVSRLPSVLRRGIELLSVTLYLASQVFYRKRHRQ